MGLRLKQPPAPHQRPRQTALEGGRSGTYWQHCTSPLPSWHSITPGGLPWVPSVGKENPGWTSSCPKSCGWHLGSPHSCLTPQGLQGNMQGLTTWSLIVTEKGEELTATSPWILADWVLTCSTQTVITTSSFAHLHSQDGGTSDQGTLQDAGLPDLGLQMKILTRPEACPVPAQAGVLSALLSIAPSCIWPEHLEAA